VQFYSRMTNREVSGAYVFVNNGPAVNISSLNHSSNYHDVVPLELGFSKGAVNDIPSGVTGNDTRVCH
jgi:hypothetical protein